MNYVTNLRQFRKQNKITQQKMADILSIPRTQYIRYEAGQNELPIRYLIIICKHFDISADWLLGIKD